MGAKVYLTNIYSNITILLLKKPSPIPNDNTGLIETVVMKILQPEVVYNYSKAANKINVTIQLRQGVLGVVKAWNTK